jgi:WD40 repeat protein
MNQFWSKSFGPGWSCGSWAVFLCGGLLAAVCCGLASGHEDTEMPLLTFAEKGTRGVYSMGSLPSQGLIVFGTDDGVIRLWDPETGKVNAKLVENGGGSLGFLVVDPKEKWIAATYDNRSILVWDIAAKTVKTRIPARDVDITCLAAGPDSDTLIYGGADHTVRILQISTQRELKTLKGHKMSAGGVAVMKDGSRIASGDGNGEIIVWDAKSGKTLHRLKGHEMEINCLVFLGATSTFATGSTDETIKIWDVRNGKEQRVLKGHVASVYRIAVSQDVTMLASADINANVAIWDLKTGNRRQWFNAQHVASILGLEFNKTGSRIVTSCVGVGFRDQKIDGEVKVWKVK